MAPQDPVKVDPNLELPPLSQADLETLFPGKRAAEQAAAADQARPLDVFRGAGTAESPDEKSARADRQLYDYIATEQQRGRERSQLTPFDADGAAFAATLAGSTAIAPFGPGIAAAVGGGVRGAAAMMAVQGGTAGFLELVTRFLNGEPMEEALPKAGETAGIFALAEGVGPVLATAGGKTIGSIRSVVHKGRQVIRALRGVKPLPEIERIASTSHPFANFLEPEAQQVYETVTEVGGIPMPSQLIQHDIIDVTQNILDRSFTAGAGQRAVRALNEKALTQAMNEVVDNLPRVDARYVGGMIQDVVTGRLQQIKGVAQGFYRQADKILGKTKEVSRQVIREVPAVGQNGAPLLDMNGKPVVRSVTETITETVPENGVNFIPLKEMAKKELELLDKGLHTNPGLEKILKEVLEKPDTVFYSTAQQVRTELFDISQQFARGAGDITPASKRAATAMTTPLTREMKIAATKAGPEARQYIDMADKLWREEIRGELTQKFITKLVNNQADDVLDAILVRGKPGDIRMIRDIVMKENPKAWDAVQGSFLQRLLYAHAEKRLIGDGTRIVGFNAKELLEDFARIQGTDGRALKELFPSMYDKGGRTLSGFKRYLQALETLQRANEAGGRGGVFFQLSQSGAIGLLVGAGTAYVTDSPVTGGAAGVLASSGYLIAPNVVGRMFRNPEIVSWLVQGAKHAPGTVPAARAAIAVLGLMVRNNLLEGDDAKRAVNQMQNLNDFLKEQEGR